MKIYNTDTNETVDLTYSPTGCDCLSDLSADDDNIKYNADEERHEADAATIEWWHNWIHATEEADSIVEALKDEVDAAAVSSALHDACDGLEMADHPASIKRAMLDLADEHGLTLKTYDDGSMGFFAK